MNKDVKEDELLAPVLHASEVHGTSEPSARPMAAEAEAEAEVEVDAAEAGDVAAVEAEPEYAEPPRSRWRFVGWALWMMFIGVLVGAVAVVFLKFVDGSVEGTTNTKTLAQLRAGAAPKAAAPDLLSGLYVEFEYPAIFDTVGQVKNDPQALEQYNIGSKTDYMRLITVNVRPLVSNRLTDDSSYRFREMNTAEYKMSTETIDKETVVIASKTDGLEQTLFWAHGGRVVAVSITSRNPKDNVGDFMKVIKGSLRWRS